MLKVSECNWGLNGTFVELTVPAEVKSKYRIRKGPLSTNILGVRDANLKFLYVQPGREGSASDARVLRDALQRPNCLNVCRDQYYLVDAGYTNGPGFLAPYRATCYNLNKWRGNTPKNYKELYNLRHPSARNAIERTFGLLKKRWAILRTASFYDLKNQIRIINACCILHNFMLGEIPKDPLLDEFSDVEMIMNNKMKSGAATTTNKARVMLTNKQAWGGTSSNSDTFADGHFEALKNKKQSYVSWNKEMDSHLAKVLADQMVQGNKCDGLHNKTIDNWDDIVLLCGKDRATGQGAENFEDGAEAMGEEEEIEVNSAPTMQPRARPSSSMDSTLNKRKKLKNHSLAEVVGVIATFFQEFVASKKKKEEKPSGIKIHEVFPKTPGLTSNEIFTVVRKLMNGDVEEYKLLKDLLNEKKRD
ncbi:hypothetical protein BUALT_Bualt04G0091700 [Buddleja alternifolia]|uniref:DDE Tnp4 domain-containing protein n=1 Tax=Buddleja alternifolia TaxID=168488 RepID=A0AAV6XUZ7_9LAMI|nr:hypothetical protein BUALT_Bualt04G0091700 [Buddleja alternifolia]